MVYAHSGHSRRRDWCRGHGGGGQGCSRRSARCSGAPSTSRRCPGAPITICRRGVTMPPNGYAMLRDELRRDLHRRARRSARARQPARTRHPARHTLRARPLRQLPAGQAARRAALPAEGPHGRRRQLRRVPREHRRALRRHRRPLQGGHRRTRSRSRKRSTPTKACTGSSGTRSSSRAPADASSVCMADKSNAMTAGPRAVAARVPRGRAAVSGDRADAPLHRRARDADGAGPGAVRGDRHQQPVRRHHHRPRRGAAGRPRHGRLGQPASRAGRRCSSRCTARRRRSPEERRQPDGRDPVGSADARDTRLEAEAAAIEAAVQDAVSTGQTTADIGGTLGTRETGDYIVAQIGTASRRRSAASRSSADQDEPSGTSAFPRSSIGMTKDSLHPRRRAHADGRLRRRAEGRFGARARRDRRARRVRAHRRQPEWIDHVVFGNVLQTSADAIYGARHVGAQGRRARSRCRR